MNVWTETERHRTASKGSLLQWRWRQLGFYDNMEFFKRLNHAQVLIKYVVPRRQPTVILTTNLSAEVSIAYINWILILKLCFKIITVFPLKFPAWDSGFSWWFSFIVTSSGSRSVSKWQHLPTLQRNLLVLLQALSQTLCNNYTSLLNIFPGIQTLLIFMRWRSMAIKAAVMLKGYMFKTVKVGQQFTQYFSYATVNCIWNIQRLLVPYLSLGTVTVVIHCNAWFW
jgi:hypothetical protein